MENKEVKKLENKVNEIVEKKRKERFELLPTFIPEVKLKSEPETKLTFPPSVFELLYNLSQDYVKRHRKINALSKEQNEKKKEIIKMAQRNKGFRGIISEKENFNLTVSPSEKISWDRDKLKESLKNFYPLAVRESMIINILIPTPENKEELIENAVKKALIRIGFDKKYLDELIQKEFRLTVDEEKINQLVESSKINLLPETKKTEISWKVRVDPISP